VRAIETLSAAVLAAGPEEAATVADQLEALLARMPPATAAGLRAGALAVDAGAVALTGRRLRALSPERGGEVLARMAAARPLALGLDAMKALVVLAGGATASGAAADTPEGPPARPDAPLDLLPAAEAPRVLRADAIVVGSGAGGAMAARTLARAGLAVLVVEEGRRHTVEEFRTRPPLERFASLYRDAGATVALGRPPVTLPLGRGVGGTTLVNSGTCFRPPAKVLARWRERGFGHDLDPFVEDVWETLQVAPSPAPVLGRNAGLALAGAAALGWEARPLDRNAPGCGGCCQCAVGCPRNAKLGVHLNALPQACAAGARIVAEARVERVLHQRGRATGVLARARDGRALELRAPLVMVAAGATETPPLLRRSGLGGHPQLGRNMALHPALSVAGRFAEPVVAWRGVLQSVGIEDFHEREGILLEATATPPGLGSLALPGFGTRLRAALQDADHLATVGAMVADAPAGRVLGRHRTVMTYALTREDGARLVRAVELCSRVLLAAGAEEVLTGLPHAPRVRDERELAAAIAGADPRALHVAAFHPTGTARAGVDAATSPVDPHGRLRGIDGVRVCDASVLPTCPEVNPQVSIMAAALSIASAACPTMTRSATNGSAPPPS
jgi:choline dehydrogenase-like flavoprotein